MASVGVHYPEIVPNWHSPEAREQRRVAIARECDDAMMALSRQRRQAPAAVIPEPVQKVGAIYFIGPRDGPIKIGFTSQLIFRLRSLRLANANPLEVWVSTPGPASLEREYHKRFAAHRLHGEWFAPHPDIMAEIDRLKEDAK